MVPVVRLLIVRSWRSVATISDMRDEFLAFWANTICVIFHGGAKRSFLMYVCLWFFQLLSSSTVCRPAVSSCDVSESCTGSSALCPVDVYQRDGTPCTTTTGVSWVFVYELYTLSAPCSLRIGYNAWSDTMPGYNAWWDWGFNSFNFLHYE